MTLPLLRLCDVNVVFGSGPPWAQRQVHAARNINLVVNPGETIGLVGESGSGKTTIGRVCLGLQQITSGRMFYRDEALPQRIGGRFVGRFSAVLQNSRTSLNPRLSVGNSISEPLVVKGGVEKAECKARVLDVLSKVGLRADMADRYPHELSGGQRQRVSIARALIVNPEFILFDESVSALDVSVQAQILNLILELQSSQGFAALFISHDLAATRYVAGRIIVMQLGLIVEEASPGDLYSPCSHPYTRALQVASGILESA